MCPLRVGLADRLLHICDRVCSACEHGVQLPEAATQRRVVCDGDCAWRAQSLCVAAFAPRKSMVLVQSAGAETKPLARV